MPGGSGSRARPYSAPMASRERRRAVAVGVTVAVVAVALLAFAAHEQTNTPDRAGGTSTASPRCAPVGPRGIVAGADGMLWVAEYGTPDRQVRALLRVDPETGEGATTGGCDIILAGAVGHRGGPVVDLSDPAVLAPERMGPVTVEPVAADDGETELWTSLVGADLIARVEPDADGATDVTLVVDDEVGAPPSSGFIDGPVVVNQADDGDVYWVNTRPLENEGILSRLDPEHADCGIAVDPGPRPCRAARYAHPLLRNALAAGARRGTAEVWVSVWGTAFPERSPDPCGEGCPHGAVVRIDTNLLPPPPEVATLSDVPLLAIPDEALTVVADIGGHPIDEPRGLAFVPERGPVWVSDRDRIGRVLADDDPACTIDERPLDDLCRVDEVVGPDRRFGGRSGEVLAARPATLLWDGARSRLWWTNGDSQFVGRLDAGVDGATTTVTGIDWSVFTDCRAEPGATVGASSLALAPDGEVWMTSYECGIVTTLDSESGGGSSGAP